MIIHIPLAFRSAFLRTRCAAVPTGKTGGFFSPPFFEALGGDDVDMTVRDDKKSKDCGISIIIISRKHPKSAQHTME